MKHTVATLVILPLKGALLEFGDQLNGYFLVRWKAHGHYDQVIALKIQISFHGLGEFATPEAILHVWDQFNGLGTS